MITVWIEGGLEQNVTGLEPGQEIRICDCDVDGAEFEDLQRVKTKKRHENMPMLTFGVVVRREKPRNRDAVL